MKKNTVRAALVLLIVLVVFSVLAFVLPVERNGVFWLAYLFFLVALLLQGYALFAAYNTGDARSRFYGFPISRIGSIYLIAQFVLSLVVMLLSEVLGITLVTVIFVLLLAAVLVGLIATEAMKDEVQRLDTKLEQEVSVMRALQSKVKVLSENCEDADCRSKLRSLAEELRYSDPVSSPAIAGAEGQLSALVEELQFAVTRADYAAAGDIARRATIVLAERNRLCKLNK